MGVHSLGYLFHRVDCLQRIPRDLWRARAICLSPEEPKRVVLIGGLLFGFFSWFRLGVMTPLEATPKTF